MDTTFLNSSKSSFTAVQEVTFRQKIVHLLSQKATKVKAKHHVFEALLCILNIQQTPPPPRMNNIYAPLAFASFCRKKKNWGAELYMLDAFCHCHWCSLIMRNRAALLGYLESRWAPGTLHMQTNIYTFFYIHMFFFSKFDCCFKFPVNSSKLLRPHRFQQAAPGGRSKCRPPTLRDPTNLSWRQKIVKYDRIQHLRICGNWFWLWFWWWWWWAGGGDCDYHNNDDGNVYWQYCQQLFAPLRRCFGGGQTWIKPLTHDSPASFPSLKDKDLSL